MYQTKTGLDDFLSPVFLFLDVVLRSKEKEHPVDDLAKDCRWGSLGERLVSMRIPDLLNIVECKKSVACK